MSGRSLHKSNRELASSLLYVAVTTCLVIVLTSPTARVGATTVHTASDPGPRIGDAGIGGPLPSLTVEQLKYFQDGLARFIAFDSVGGTIPGATSSGLGPTYNATSVVRHTDRRLSSAA
jgi:hypothetical protein